MQKYGLSGHFPAVPGKGAELAAILVRASELLAGAKGLHLYIVGQQQDSPDTVWVNEVWDSPEDHQASLQMPGVAELIGEARPLIGGLPTQYKLDVHGGKGLS